MSFHQKREGATCRQKAGKTVAVTETAARRFTRMVNVSRDE
jgi:hypothetical protein